MAEINNKGQVLLILIISLAVLLGIGLSISSQSISSVTRTSRTDSLQKVTAAAEGGIEKYLLYTDATLNGFVGKTNLIEKFLASNTESNITVAYYTAEASSSIIYPEVNPAQVANFYFSDDPKNQTYSGQKTCLKITTDTPNPSYMLNVYIKNSTVTPFVPSSLDFTYDASSSNKFLLEKYIVKSGSFDTASPTSCGTGGIEFTNGAVLRISPITASLQNLKIEILSSDFTNIKKVVQGYTITSVGKFSSGSDSSQRKITAYKFLDSPSYLFDYTAFID